MTSVHRVATGAIAASLVAGLTVVATATPAAAATKITSPSEDTVASSATKVTATLDVLTKGRLLVNPPDGPERVADTGYKSISTTVGGSSVPNGTYEVTLQSALTALWVDRDKVTVVVRDAPSTPDGVTATRSGRKVTLRWDAGSEPDLVGYEAVSSFGETVRTSGTSATFTVPSSAAGRRVGFGVKARRHTSPGSSSTISSPTSNTEYVTMPGASTARESSGGGRAGGAGGLDDSYGEVAAPSALPDLEPLSKNSPLSLPNVSPDQEFQYSDPEGDQAVTGLPEAKKSPQVRAAEAIASLSPQRWGLGAAAALLVLLVAAHIGTWSRRLRPAPAAARVGKLAKTRDRDGDDATTAEASGNYRGRRRRAHRSED
ncbi:MAG: hypothetical protein GEV11_04045 [Streptosporangiales bacterium]|nr:hypothetical protein [Streptosporangiales bacterium]